MLLHSEVALKDFDDAVHEWTADSGEFTAHIAAASDDIRFSLPFSLK